jgi:hypothetical protein
VGTPVDEDEAVRSGSGIARLLAGSVEFAATDATMTDAKVAAAARRSRPVLQVPTVPPRGSAIPLRRREHVDTLP